MKILLTGGCGFIGSAFVRLALDSGHQVVNFDKLTYAGNPANVADVADDPGYEFVRGDIADGDLVGEVMDGIDLVVNMAAETHVDRSIMDPAAFPHTDVVGTAVLLDHARRAGVRRFVQVSTDEVYGSVPSGAFRETDPLAPSSPYSASKAGGDLQVLAWHRTYGFDCVITRGSNTYGPRQYPEKLIPLFVTNALDGESNASAPLPTQFLGNSDAIERGAQAGLGKQGYRRRCFHDFGFLINGGIARLTASGRPIPERRKCSTMRSAATSKRLRSRLSMISRCSRSDWRRRKSGTEKSFCVVWRSLRWVRRAPRMKRFADPSAMKL